MSKEIRLLSTSAILGYGFPEASLQAGLARDPHFIGVDGGSVDPGPHYLGSGKPFCSPIAIRRDLRLMLRAAIEHKIPMVIGTCGGAGGEPHLALVAGMVREIAREEGLHFKMATIHAEQDKADLKRRVAAGTISPLAHQPPLTEATAPETRAPGSSVMLPLTVCSEAAAAWAPTCTSPFTALAAPSAALSSTMMDPLTVATEPAGVPADTWIDPLIAFRASP